MFTHSQAMTLRSVVFNTCLHWYAVVSRDPGAGLMPGKPRRSEPVWYLTVVRRGEDIEDGPSAHDLRNYEDLGTFLRVASILQHDQ
jgi:hypothetical protein